MDTRKELIEQTALLQAIFENSEAGTVAINSSGKILLANSRLEQITGFCRDDVEGKINWREFVIEEDQDTMSRYLQLLRIQSSDRPEKIEIRFRNSDNKLCTAYSSAFQVPDQKLIIISFVDITEQKATEVELQLAKEHAENSERLKTAFLANMSHEIRTPINSIVGFADLLKMEGLSDAKKILYLNQVIHGSHDLLLLIEKIITISRLDSGQLKLNKREFNLNQKMEEILEKFQEELIQRDKAHIALSYKPGKEDSNYQIVGDPMRLTEILSNLLENAVKFTEEGRIEFGYYLLEDEEKEGDGEESGESGESGESILFYVKDSGMGIEKKKKNLVFDRFVKVIEKEETLYKGAGLGLAIAKDLVSLFNGSIWVESTKGSGSRFFFSIPLGKTRAKRALPKESDNAGKSSMDWSDKEILIAEDVESNYLFIKELLSPTKVKILRARDGLEALDLFDNNPLIDIVIMDILMPGMDGYEATEEIRKRKPEIPVIAQSAFTFEGDIQDGLYAGCFNDYIMKPYTQKILIAVISKYFTS